MRTVDEAGKLGRAFRLGLAFGKGKSMSGSVAQDSEKGDDEDVKFRTLKNGNVVAIKDGKIVGGAGSKVGPDNIPSLEFFASAEERKEQSYSKTVTQYARTHLKPLIESLRYPGGMPPDCERIEVNGRSIDEIAAKMNSNKAAALPYIAEVYRKGTYTVEKEKKKPNAYALNIFTEATIKVNGRDLKVTVITKQRQPKQQGERYLQYGIGKADEVANDAVNESTIYEFSDLEIEKP